MKKIKTKQTNKQTNKHTNKQTKQNKTRKKTHFLLFQFYVVGLKVGTELFICVYSKGVSFLIYTT